MEILEIKFSPSSRFVTFIIVIIYCFFIVVVCLFAKEHRVNLRSSEVFSEPAPSREYS